LKPSQGTEIVALAAGEAENPRKNVPKAINKVFYRILIFYVGGMTVVGLLVPYTSPQLLGGSSDATSSPFVIAIKSAGISALPDIVNVVILTAVFSAANSDLCKCFLFCGH
jgi:amino acid transporter